MKASWIGTLLLCSVVVSSAQPAETQAPALFVAAPAGLDMGSNAMILRQRFARPDRELLTSARVNAGRSEAAPSVLRLNLFEDALLDVVIRDTGPTSTDFWLAGHLMGDELSDFTLVVNGRVVVGTVRTPSAVYRIATGGDDHVAIRQVDRSTLLREAPLVRDPPPAAGQRILPILPPPAAGPAGRRIQPIMASPARRAALRNATDVSGGREDGSRIDILAVYTPTATELYGGPDAIRAELDLAVAETNQAYANSGVEQRINLIFATEVNYTPHPDGETNLRRLHDPNDGYLDEVHDIRDRVAADFVTLEPGGNHIQGVSTGVMRADSAFTSQGISGYGFAHEFGHLQGLSHDRYQVTKETTTDLSEFEPPYAFGYVNQAACEPDPDWLWPYRGWVTVMAYFTQLDDQECTRSSGVPLMRFSNPTQTYLGDPLGAPGTEPSSSITGPADARRTLNRYRRTVANFRVAPCLTDGMWVRLQASSGEFVVAMDGGGGEVVANRSQPGPWGRFQVIDRNGGCLESGDPLVFMTSEGWYLSINETELPHFVEATEDYHRSDYARFYALLKGTGYGRTRTGAVRSGDLVTFHHARSVHYVGAEQGGGGALLVAYDVDGPWQTFRITSAD